MPPYLNPMWDALSVSWATTTTCRKKFANLSIIDVELISRITARLATGGIILRMATASQAKRQPLRQLSPGSEKKVVIGRVDGKIPIVELLRRALRSVRSAMITTISIRKWVDALRCIPAVRRGTQRLATAWHVSQGILVAQLTNNASLSNNLSLSGWNLSQMNKLEIVLLRRMASALHVLSGIT